MNARDLLRLTNPRKRGNGALVSVDAPGVLLGRISRSYPDNLGGGTGGGAAAYIEEELHVQVVDIDGCLVPTRYLARFSDGYEGWVECILPTDTGKITEVES